MSYNINIPGSGFSVLDDIFEPLSNITAQPTGFNTGAPGASDDLNQRFESIVSGSPSESITGYIVNIPGSLNYEKDLNQIFAAKGSVMPVFELTVTFLPDDNNISGDDVTSIVVSVIFRDSNNTPSSTMTWNLSLNNLSTGEFDTRELISKPPGIVVKADITVTATDSSGNWQTNEYSKDI